MKTTNYGDPHYAVFSVTAPRISKSQQTRYKFYKQEYSQDFVHTGGSYKNRQYSINKYLYTYIYDKTAKLWAHILFSGTGAVGGVENLQTLVRTEGGGKLICWISHLH